MWKTGITLLALGCLALVGCDEAAMSPDSQASFDEAAAGADTDEAVIRGRFGRNSSRWTEAIKQKGDEQALALLEMSQQERGYAQTAMGTGDRDAARTHMEASRAAMYETVTRTFPDYAQRMAQVRERWREEHPEGFTRASAELRHRMGIMRFDEARMQSMIESYLEKNPENTESVDRLKQEVAAISMAIEAGDEDAAREHSRALRELLRELRPDGWEYRRFQTMRGEQRP